MTSYDYDPTFYDEIRESCITSANAIAPIVYGLIGGGYGALKVVDVGCGEGWWGKAFEDLGCNAVGLDSGVIDIDPPIERINYSIGEELPDINGSPVRGADLAICLEVAEHVDAALGDALVIDLCNISDRVLFSAATPGQGGHGHINEQPHFYWHERFEAQQFSFFDLRSLVAATDAAPWYRNNLFLYLSNRN